MRLKRILISGFKSFCDPTEFSFLENGITVVVGPNGCGKSNIVDALRWVLGEQSPRQLRGREMVDVIFGGSMSRKPIGRCEVTVVFDNTEGLALEKYRAYSEISVTRRLYRSGEGEYLINSLHCRLMDIRELVMDTGVAGKAYSIIEQGRVDAFISATPAERRIFVEEAAGIVRYKTRRIAAERRLEQSDQNLLRVGDLIGELQRQEDSLRGQMEAAQEYLALRDKVGGMGQRLAHARYWKGVKRCRDLERDVQTLSAEQDGHNQQLELLQIQVERNRNDVGLAEGNLRAARAKAYDIEREIQQQETASALARQNRENAQHWIDQLTAQRGALHEKFQNMQRQIKTAQAKSEALEIDGSTSRARMDAVEAHHTEKTEELESAAAQLARTQERLVECHTTLMGITNQERFIEERVAEWQRRATAIDEILRTTRDELQDARDSRSKYAGELAACQRDQELTESKGASLQSALTGNEADFRNAQHRLGEATREELGCQSRVEALAEMESGYQDFGESVRGLLEWVDASPGGRDEWGLLGPLSDFIEIEPDKVPIFGDFLGAYLEILVLRESRHIAPLAEILRQNELGAVRLVTLDTIGRRPLPEASGPTLAGLVKLPAHLEPVKRGLFDPVRLLPDGSLQPSVPPTAAGEEWISPAGDYHMDPRGVVTIGRAPEQTSPAASGILRRRSELQALRGRFSELEKRRESAERETQRLENEIRAQRAEISRLVEGSGRMALTRSRLEQVIDHANEAVDRSDSSIGRLEADRDQLRRDLEDSAAQRAQMVRERAEWNGQQTRLESDLAAEQDRAHRARMETGELEQGLTDDKVEYARIISQLEQTRSQLDVLAAECKETSAKLRETESEMERQQALASNHDDAVRNGITHLGQMQENLQAARERTDQVSAHHEQLTGRGEGLAQQIKTAQAASESVRGKKHELELALTAERMRLEQWSEQAGDGPPPDEGADPEDEAQLEREWKNGRQRLEQMTGVNLAAPEEHEELHTRLEFLMRQRGDLERAAEDLKESIRRMNQESRRRFKDTFEKVNSAFERIFPEVFSGGEGRLVLTDSEDMLLAGVDIVAQPPGKRLQEVSLLSGGEKAMTAIALIFSFFSIKPSPFCVLDEVDAPLDDANVGRFNRLMRNMTDRTQFIMITHNRRTMESGDLLYGVTMEDAGVSKVVSVNLTELAS